MPVLRETMRRGLLAAGAVALTLGAAEGSLRLFYPPVRGHFTVAPGTEWTVQAAPTLMPGVFGTNRYRVNALGIRGPAFGDARTEYRILAVGGSTTQCATLDALKAWPSLLGQDLGRTSDDRSVWVGNVGRSGATSRDNVLHLKYLLRELPHVDAVLVLVGSNDLISALHQGWSYRLPAPITDAAAERERLPLAFALLPGTLQDPAPYYGLREVPWYKATALWQLVRQARVGWHRWRYFDLHGLERVRRRRHDATLIDSLPPLATPLIEFRRNLNIMVDLAAAAHVRLVFLTQPSLWRDVMSAPEQRLLWLGGLEVGPVPGSTYFSTGALARAMATYNGAILDVCKERGIECWDAAAHVPRDTSMMWDDVHYTEAGARELAQGLAAYLGARPPWAERTLSVRGSTPR